MQSGEIRKRPLMSRSVLEGGAAETDRSARRTFLFSIIYLFAIIAANRANR